MPMQQLISTDAQPNSTIGTRLTPADHKIIIEQAKTAWSNWYNKGIRTETLSPQDTLEFWTIIETEKYLRKLLLESTQ